MIRREVENIWKSSEQCNEVKNAVFSVSEINSTLDMINRWFDTAEKKINDFWRYSDKTNQN